MKHKFILPLCLAISIFTSNQLLSNPEKVDYLIITRDIFVAELGPLKTYKESKGTSVTIITLENLINLFSGRDVQEKIRNCISDYFINHQIEYVLLVGSADADDNPGTATTLRATVIDKAWEIPVRYVYCPTGHYAPYTYVPCEMYYSNLNGNWDDDMDGIYGELWMDNKDGIDESDWVPEIALGRIPCQTKAELTIYISKLLSVDYTNLSDSEIKALSITAKINREIMFSNAKEKNKDFIISETKKW